MKRILYSIILIFPFIACQKTSDKIIAIEIGKNITDTFPSKAFWYPITNYANKVPVAYISTKGNTIVNESEAAQAIAGHFQGQFSSADVKPISIFEGQPRELNRMITAPEVLGVVKTMKSGKAIGPVLTTFRIKRLLNHRVSSEKDVYGNAD